MNGRRYRRTRQLVLAGAGLAAAQAIAGRRDAARYPPPGRLVDIGGYRLHLVVDGQRNGRPAVVLEAGMGSFSSNWHWVQRELAGSMCVVSYDRAGLGWSDPSPRPRDVRTMALELHLALDAAGVGAPYVLAGHSFGGLVVRAFADRFPDDTAGLVLVDASHPDQWARWPVHAADRMLAASQAVSAGLGVFGLLRAANLSSGIADGLPPRQVAELRARSASARTALTEARQTSAWRTASRAQVNDARPLGTLPLFVLSVTEQPTGAATLTMLQEELPALSDNSVHHVVTGATHESLVSQRDHAGVVAEAVRAVVAASTNGRLVWPFQAAG